MDFNDFKNCCDAALADSNYLRRCCDVVRCSRCVYYEPGQGCTHPVVRATKKTIGCDHGETFEMVREREQREAERADDPDQVR